MCVHDLALLGERSIEERLLEIAGADSSSPTVVSARVHCPSVVTHDGWIG